MAKHMKGTMLKKRSSFARTVDNCKLILNLEIKPKRIDDKCCGYYFVGILYSTCEKCPLRTRARL